jgi:SAM-dependent methyltransferase
MSSPSPEQRFSNRVENYIRYRPGYPPELIHLLERGARLTPDSAIADIGAGTGIFSELLLNAGYQVDGIEPNQAMRKAAEKLLAGYPRFRSVGGSAQQTTLPDTSIDLIVSAQAFHWFDTAEARAEFRRILKPGGKIALIWNERHLDTTPFLRGYEALLQRFATDYAVIRHENVGPESLKLLFPDGYTTHVFPNSQVFDFEGLKGRLLSSSYTPAPGQPGHELMLQELRRLFDEHQRDGQVSVDYDARLYLGG